MDIIHLLPDSVANQIAAGEVVQRPSSVVKELIENSIDAEATNISVFVESGGKTLIQVIDNGKGMSERDLRMAFERHATSKISKASDLFSLTTFGFRGEALPSIASVADVEVKSRERGAETGSLLRISAGAVKESAPVATPEGTNIRVRELFYNIPARRKFLKSDSTELRNITQEFIRTALTHPEIEFSLTHDGKELYSLPESNIRKRIVNIFGKSIEPSLMAVECKTEMLEIGGFICNPTERSGGRGEQFFFTNGRFMRHPLFNKAVTEAYAGLLRSDAQPSYFLYFTVKPEMIDVNIHPSKTEIKFQHESDCYRIITLCVREVLGKFNIIPPIDFDRDGEPPYSWERRGNAYGVSGASGSGGYGPNGSGAGSNGAGGYTPDIAMKRGYNPFNYDSNDGAPGNFGGATSGNFGGNAGGFGANASSFGNGGGVAGGSGGFGGNAGSYGGAPHGGFGGNAGHGGVAGWERLFAGLDDAAKSDNGQQRELQHEGAEGESTENRASWAHSFDKYIIASMPKGIALIDKRAAHIRILYDRLLLSLESGKAESQRLMFPEVMDLSAEQATIMRELLPQLETMGFECRDEGNSTFTIKSAPSSMSGNASSVIAKLINDYYDSEGNSDVIERERKIDKRRTALLTARAAAINRNTPLSDMECEALISELLSCEEPSISPDGKEIISILTLEKLSSLL